MGQAPDGETYNQDGIGLPLLAGAGDFDNESPQPKKFTTAKNVRTSEPGDVVIGIRASIGDKVLADKIYCLGRGVAGLRAGPSVSPRYLWHWVTHAAPTLSAKGRGATFLQVNKNDIAELEIPLPPIDEQRRIASILDAADALRTKRRQALAKLDTLTQAIFIDMFGDPVTNPKRWTTVALSEFGDLDRGVSKHRPRNDPDLLGGRWPLIQTGDVANSGGYIRTFTATYSDLGLAQSKIWPTGTLCITIAANIAKTGILTFDACFPDSVVGFTSQEDHRAEYVRAFMRFLQPVLELQAPESAQKNINLKVLRCLEIPVPPDEQVRLFSATVSSASELSWGIGRHAARLDYLLTSLQHRAFRGEL